MAGKGLSARFVLAAWISGLVFLSAADSKADRKKSDAAYQRGRHADAAGKRDEAIDQYTAAIEADPRNAAGLCARAADYLAQGDHDKAGRDYDTAIAVAPADGAARAARAAFLSATGQPQRAIQEYETALALTQQCLLSARPLRRSPGGRAARHLPGSPQRRNAAPAFDGAGKSGRDRQKGGGE